MCVSTRMGLRVDVLCGYRRWHFVCTSVWNIIIICPVLLWRRVGGETNERSQTGSKGNVGHRLNRLCLGIVLLSEYVSQIVYRSQATYAATSLFQRDSSI